MDKKVEWYHIAIIIAVVLIAINMIKPDNAICPTPKACECKPPTVITKDVPANYEEINNLKKQIKIQSQIIGIDRKGLLIAASFIPLIEQAAKAGMLRDVTEIQRITNKINSNTVKIQNLTVQKTKLTTQLTELQK